MAPSLPFPVLPYKTPDRYIFFTRVKLLADLRSPRNVNSADGFGGYHRGDGHRIGAKKGVTGGADGRLAGGSRSE